jgi:hypothetical protein
MKRKFALFTVISFLSVQMLSLLHMAEYEFEKHEHDGKMCDIYLHGKQANSAVIPSIASLQELTFVEVRLQSFISVRLSKSVLKGAPPRAPPVSLLS